MKLTKIAAGVSASVALLSAGTFASVVPQASVQAASKYQVRVSKKAYVYTSKGKKTKKSYKKNAKLTVYGTKTIKGKKYYNLGKGRYIRTSNAKKVFVRYSYSTQTKKITRTIKLYQPTGEKKVIQNAYIKRSVKTDNKTKKKTYGKWSISSWKKYTVAKVEGYTASRSSVGAAKVTYKRKNQTIKVTYKKNASAANSSSSSSSSTSKPTNSGSKSSSSSSSAKKTFTVKAIKEVTTSRGKEYEYTMYSKKGSTFIDEGKSTVMDGNQTFTVSDQSTDSQGNTYYYVTDSDGDKYWVLSTDTDKSDKSHVEKNTLSITPANFNVKRNVSSGDGSKNIDMFTLNSDNTLSSKKNAATTEYFEGAYYPIVYHVSATATDKNGVKWYNIADPLDNNSSVWVKMDGFINTDQAVGSTHPTLVWDEYWQKKTSEDFLKLLNDIRAKAGNGAKPLVYAYDKQDEVNRVVKKYAEKSAASGYENFYHTTNGVDIKRDAENNNGVSLGKSMNDVSSAKMAYSLLDSFKQAIRAEKETYDAGYTGFGETTGHYINIINPAFTKVCVGSTAVTINGKAYVVEYQEFWK